MTAPLSAAVALLAVPGVLLAVPGVLLLGAAAGIAAVLYDVLRARRSRRALPYTASSVRELLDLEEDA